MSSGHLTLPPGEMVGSDRTVAVADVAGIAIPAMPPFDEAAALADDVVVDALAVAVGSTNALASTLLPMSENMATATAASATPQARPEDTAGVNATRAAAASTVVVRRPTGSVSQRLKCDGVDAGRPTEDGGGHQTPRGTRHEGPPEGQREPHGVRNEQAGGHPLVAPVRGHDGGVDQGAHQAAEEGEPPGEAGWRPAETGPGVPKAAGRRQRPQPDRASQTTGPIRISTTRPGRCSPGTAKRPLDPVVCITKFRMVFLHFPAHTQGTGRIWRFP